MLDQLRDLEASGRDGHIDLPDGDELSVTNLRKIFWPKPKLTKGALFRYYVEAAPYILPAVQDRPLTMKRLPNGIAAPAFYQHRAPDKVPPNVRVETVRDDDVPSRFIGGNLKTLLHMTQLAAISQDPWFSRVASIDAADHVALDLDPPRASGSIVCSTSRDGFTTSSNASAPSGFPRRLGPTASTSTSRCRRVCPMRQG